MNAALQEKKCLRTSLFFHRKTIGLKDMVTDDTVLAPKAPVGIAVAVAPAELARFQREDKPQFGVFVAVGVDTRAVVT